jgi:hypothetical protein
MSRVEYHLQLRGLVGVKQDRKGIKQSGPALVDGLRGVGFCVTADDNNTVKLFNYPVVANDAPFRAFKGHASHVMAVRFGSSLCFQRGEIHREIENFWITCSFETAFIRGYIM